MPTPLLDNRQLGPDVGRANLLTNGGFENWQRGNGPYTANGNFTADRWQLFLSGSGTGSVQKDTANMNTGLACLMVTPGGTQTLPPPANAQANGTAIIQYIEDYPSLRNRVMTLSMRVASVDGSICQLLENDGVVQVNSSTFTMSSGGSYQTITFTFTVSASASRLYLGVMFGSTAAWRIDNAMLVVGSQVADYVPMHPADDMIRCLRYYEISQTSLRIYATAASQYQTQGVVWRQMKAVAPTVTLTQGTQVANASAPTYYTWPGFETSGGRVELNSVAAGEVYSTFIKVVAEANP